MRKTITIIAATIAAFAMSAASCEQLAPPAVDQIVTFQDADPGCELGVTQTLGACDVPEQAPPASDAPNADGLGYPTP